MNADTRWDSTDLGSAHERVRDPSASGIPGLSFGSAVCLVSRRCNVSSGRLQQRLCPLLLFGRLDYSSAEPLVWVSLGLRNPVVMYKPG